MNKLRAFLLENNGSRLGKPMMEASFKRGGNTYWSHKGKFFMKGPDGSRKEIGHGEYEMAKTVKIQKAPPLRPSPKAQADFRAYVLAYRKEHGDPYNKSVGEFTNSAGETGYIDQQTAPWGQNFYAAWAGNNNETFKSQQEAERWIDEQGFKAKGADGEGPVRSSRTAPIGSSKAKDQYAKDLERVRDDPKKARELADSLTNDLHMAIRKMKSAETDSDREIWHREKTTISDAIAALDRAAG